MADYHNNVGGQTWACIWVSLFYRKENCVSQKVDDWHCPRLLLIKWLKFSVILFKVTKSLFKVPEHGSRKPSLFRLRRGLLVSKEVSSQTRIGSPTSGILLNHSPSWDFSSAGDHIENDAQFRLGVCQLQWSFWEGCGEFSLLSLQLLLDRGGNLWHGNVL